MKKILLNQKKTYKDALAYVKDAISPAFMKVYPNKLQINNTFVKTLFCLCLSKFSRMKLAYLLNH